jgi:hypothetical protein
VESELFIILVADRDATVGVVSSSLLSAALNTKRALFDAKVRVLVEPEIITGLEAPELPEEIRRIEEKAISATASDIKNANLIVSFSGMDLVKLAELRDNGVAAPAVNLCQFANSLQGATRDSDASQIDVREVVVSAALQFGFGGGSSICTICEAKEGDNLDYWLNIADTCSRFAQTVHELRSLDLN